MNFQTVFLTFVYIGCITFGGGYAMLGAMERELVGRKGWLTSEEFLDMTALSQSLPGPLAVSMASLLGRRLNPVWGSWAAYAGVILPSLIIIGLIAQFLEPYMSSPWIRAAFWGLNPAVLGMMLASLFQLGGGLKREKFNVLLAGFAFAGLVFLHWHPIVIIVIAGFAGYWVRGGRNHG